MKTRVRIEVPTIESNLSESLKIKVRRDWWDITISNSKIIAISRKEYETPGVEWSNDDLETDRRLQDLTDTVVGHIRNAMYFAYGLSMQWGYEAYYGVSRSSSSLEMFPSIHQTGSSIQYAPDRLKIMKQMFEDVGSSKLKPLIIMLNYSRRAEELNDLGFHTEAFLNHYKILECLEAMDENHTAKMGFLNKFAPVKTVGDKKDRVPMSTLQRKFGKRRSNGSLVSHIEKSAKMLATANFSSVRTGFMMYLMELTDIRNGYNVAHALAYYNKYDTYRGVGQHSDEFEYVIRDLWNIETMSKLLMLNYAFPGKYKYDWKERAWELN